MTTNVIKVAVLVTSDVRPKDLSALLDFAFKGVDEVLQFVVEGAGSSDLTEATDAALMDSLVGATAERLLADPLE